MKKFCSLMLAVIFAMAFGTTSFAADYYNEDIGILLDAPYDGFVFYPEMTEEYFAQYDDYSKRSYERIMDDFAENGRACEILYRHDGRKVSVRISDGANLDYRTATEEEVQDHLDRWIRVFGKEAEIYESEIYRTRQTAFIRLVYKYFDKDYVKEAYITFANGKMIFIYLYPNGRTITGDESDYVKFIVDSIRITKTPDIKSETAESESIENESIEDENKKADVMIIVYAVVITAFAAIIISSVKKAETIETAPEEQNYTAAGQSFAPFEKTFGRRKFCTLCGAKLKKGSDFCHECGAPVEK